MPHPGRITTTLYLSLFRGIFMNRLGYVQYYILLTYIQHKNGGERTHDTKLLSAKDGKILIGSQLQM